jgi:hypothetical protein
MFFSSLQKKKKSNNRHLILLGISERINSKQEKRYLFLFSRLLFCFFSFFFFFLVDFLATQSTISLATKERQPKAQ